MNKLIDQYFVPKKRKIDTIESKEEEEEEEDVVVISESTNMIISLINHPLTDKILQHPTTKKFVYNGKEYDGLMTTIKKKFLSPNVLEVMYKDRTKQRKSLSGVAIGSRVHRQVHHMVECVKNKRECDCETKTNPNRLHKYTDDLFLILDSMKIRPLHTEVPVIAEKYGIATRLDMIGEQDIKTEKSQKETISVRISLKTGFDFKTFETSTNTLQSPYNSTPASFRIVNQLQSLYEDVILYHCYNKMKFDKSYIIYIGMKNSGNGETFVDTKLPPKNAGFNIEDEKLLQFISTVPLK